MFVVRASRKQWREILNLFHCSAMIWLSLCQFITTVMIISTIIRTASRIEDIVMLDGFIIKALVAGIGVALVVGVLGCFVVWRRMAYFGDSLAHSSLLGIALGLLYGFSINIGVIIICSVLHCCWSGCSTNIFWQLIHCLESWPMPRCHWEWWH